MVRLSHLDIDKHAFLSYREDISTTVRASPRRRPIGESFPLHLWVVTELHSSLLLRADLLYHMIGRAALG
jgi:hypothetical protein